MEKELAHPLYLLRHVDRRASFSRAFRVRTNVISSRGLYSGISVSSRAEREGSRQGQRASISTQPAKTNEHIRG